jgi:hypothetical protein
MNGGAIPPLPIHLHGVVLNELSTGTILPYLTKYYKGDEIEADI